MGITTTIQPIDPVLELFYQEHLSPQAQRAMLAQFARENIEQAKKINSAALGKVPPHETFIDGVRSDALDRVAPTSVVTTHFDLLHEAVVWIVEQLEIHSPVGRTGKYKESHTLFVDGKKADPRKPLLREFGELVFMALVAYARKIELAEWSEQAPQGVYQGVAQLARHRYGRIADIAFGFRPAMGIPDLDVPDRRWPAIIIRLKDAESGG